MINSFRRLIIETQYMTETERNALLFKGIYQYTKEGIESTDIINKVKQEYTYIDNEAELYALVFANLMIYNSVYSVYKKGI